MNLSQETDEKRLMPLRAAAEHMSKKFTMKVQEVKPRGRRLKKAPAHALLHMRAFFDAACGSSHFLKEALNLSALP